jgi:subtilisin-like proprotein convertase family protein
MQPKFTLKNTWMYLRKGLVVLLLGTSGFASAQTVLSTASGTGYGGDLSVANTAPLSVSLVVQNTTASAVALTDLSTQLGPFAGISAPGDPLTTKLWASTTSLSGIYDVTAPGWAEIGTGAAVVPAAVTVTPVITGINYIIPAGAQVRLVIECTKGLRISGPFAGFPLPTPNSFTNAGLVLKLGDNQISGANVGWGGLTSNPNNTPTFFGGTVTLASTVPCSGTPAPGNTVSSVGATVCPGINFNLTAQNATPGAGVTYQWQSGPSATGPWTNVSTNATYTTNQNVATWYQVVVTCGGNSGTSTPLLVNMTPASGCYCIPPTSDCTDNDMITRVVFGTINNTSTCSPAGYADYTNSVAPTDVIAGGPNPIRVEAPANWTEQIAVWIDYNKNGQFEASEFTNVGTKPGGATFVNGTVNVPASATLGSTRMRVRTRFSTALGGGDACLGYAFGETEDYTVNIIPCVPIAITTHPANASIACASNASFTVATTGSIPSYSWEYRPNATSAWQMVTNGGIYSGATTSTLTLTNVPGTMAGYQYRALVSGACSAVDFSNAATLTVTPIVATVNPTSATICTGSIQQLTLTNASSPATVTFNSTGPVAIPDNTPAGMSSTIAVSGIPAGAIVTNISVTLNITHTYVGDLDINLIAPNNANMNLVGGLDGGTGSNGTDNFVNTVISSTSTTAISGAAAPRTGTFAAEKRVGYGPAGNEQTAAIDWPALLTTLNGNWRLVAADFFGLDIGTVNSWSISITYGAPATGVWTASPAAPNTMFTDALATVPYVAGSQATTIYVNPTVNTNYSVVYSTATPCVSNPTVIPVTVINPVGAVTDPVNTAVCVGGNGSFTVSAAGGPNTYQWQISTDGGTTWTNVAGATGATLNLTGVTQTMNNNRYRAVITAAPCAGSVNSAAAILTVNALPVVTLTSSDVSVIPSQTTTLTATSTPAAAANGWSWTLNHNPIPGTGNTQVAGVDQLGLYQAQVTDVNGCVSLSNELEITAEAGDRLWIYPNPTSGQFQVRLFYNDNVAERRTITIYNQLGQVMTSKHFDLVSGTAPYLQMDFDLGHLPRGIYVVKVAHQFTGKVTSGLVVLQ